MSKTTSRLLILIVAAALALSAMAQQPISQTTYNSPLAALLAAKGILSSSDLALINQATSPADADARLARLLVEKGLISQQELANTVSYANDSGPRLVNAMVQSGQVQPPSAPTGAPPEKAGPAGISAVAPLRVLSIDPPKQTGLIPDIRMGSGANLKLYGFFKASAIEDTASSGGGTFGDQDWPLPLLIGGDTGPTSDPSFHIKARSFRVGGQFNWVPKNSDWVITGKVEADFEGDYTDVSNRNISGSVRSQFSLRLAYMRLDHKIGDLPWFAEFGRGLVSARFIHSPQLVRNHRLGRRYGLTL
jgi:hypothetical protein